MANLSPLQGNCNWTGNQQPSSLTWRDTSHSSTVGEILLGSCDWTNKHIWSATSYRNMMPYETLWTVFSRYFLHLGLSCSRVTWFVCVFLLTSPLINDCKERPIFTGITVSTSEQWRLSTLPSHFRQQLMSLCAPMFLTNKIPNTQNQTKTKITPV